MKNVNNACLVGEELAVGFGDGSEIFLGLELLRRGCPCAKCQGEPDALGRVQRPAVAHGVGAFDLKHIELVGGYGLQLHWADGHGTGIYTIAYLEKLAALG